MTDVIIIVVLLVIVGAAVVYIMKAKKSGVRCIGCPSGGSCSGSCSGNCSGGTGCGMKSTNSCTCQNNTKEK